MGAHSPPKRMRSWISRSTEENSSAALLQLLFHYQALQWFISPPATKCQKINIHRRNWFQKWYYWNSWMQKLNSVVVTVRNTRDTGRILCSYEFQVDELAEKFIQLLEIKCWKQTYSAKRINCTSNHTAPCRQTKQGQGWTQWQY